MVLYAVPTNGWQALAIARRHGVPVLFRAIDVSHALRKTVYAPLIQRAERYICRNADLVSCNNEALQAYVRANGAPAERTRVDYPGLDLCRFSPGPRSASLCARYGIAERHRTVLFMGTLYRFSGLDWFLEEFARVLRQDSQVKLLVFGGGEWESELHRLVHRLGVVDAVIAPGFIEYSELADHIRLADVAINPFRSSLVTNCALPGKVLQYLGCGVPTVCSPLEGMMGMVQDGCGISYRPEGPSFVDAVCTLLDSAAVRASASVAARSEMVRQCNWDHALGRFEDAIRCAIAARRGSRRSKGD
jgi:glycosyltransferase involved in cell wall biosynthesis